MVREDVPFLHDWDRREIWPEISTRPWAPALLADKLKEFDEGKRGRGDDQHVPLTVVADGMCVGQVTLWGIDAHNRRAHLGIGLGPEHRCRGYGSDACRALLEYAFIDRGLNRVQLEVLADNDVAIRAYQAAPLKHLSYVEFRWLVWGVARVRVAISRSVGVCPA